MKKAIVLGATGGTGSAIVRELINRGIPTIAFGRSSEKLLKLKESYGNPEYLTLQTGDVFQVEDVYKAASEADVIFQCAAVPYNKMEEQQLPLGEAVLKAANRLGAKVVFVDGIYPYGHAKTQYVNEDHPKNPHTKKGKIKLEFEKLIFHSRWNQSKHLIVRLPDYYGPTANKSSYLGMTMEAIAEGKTAMFIGNMTIPREYVYLPDAADMIVELASLDEAYGQNWNIPGSGVISGRELVQLAQKARGISKPVIPLRKASLTFIGMFDPIIREIVEMLYLTEEPVVLDGSKYERLVGPIPATPYEKGIEDTIQALVERNKQTTIDQHT
ncbi:SDR family NAD(P)-dependent oxidoreductase [Bacillus sp. 03113]|uniref:SDR family NAD(P)-dependent oxidoreductase n=1 Tax=Bacillus sp. 03113 TaxID=2578211 RepID=UPI0011436A4A|nr:SDR family NAD(P)-dependent oxidoreductase [Bacillus sp. 03113]